MYKNQRNKRPIVNKTKTEQPVFVSQKRNEIVNKENEAEIVPSSQQDEENLEVPSSQNENPMPGLLSQSRFLSQRHQITRATQEHQMRGKNYFEIGLIACKLHVTDIGCEFVNEGDDPISFIRRFRSFLGSQNDSAKKFIDGFVKAFSLKEESLKESQKFLTGIIMKEARISHRSQTSLIQCFLAVSSLTDEIAKYLLSNLKTYVTERGEHADRFIVGLVVAQFKFSEQFLESSTYNVMYDKFFEILRETKSDACRAVIIFNFLDLDEFKQDDAVKRLLTMYEDNLELLTPFIETFTEMCISEETKARISSIVEHLLENNCAAELYPGIVKYLLYYTKSPEEIVDNLRRHLKWGDSAEVNWQSLKSKVFKLLEKAVRRQESKIADAWIKIIGALKTPQDLKPVDFVMLLLILSIKEDKFNAIKKVLCQKVPIGFFTSDFLENCFSTFASIIAQYSGILLEMLGALQKNNNYEINEFSSTCFKEHFALDSSDKKEIIGTLVQFLCEKTPQASFLPKSDFKMMTLNILGEIKKKQSSAEDLLLNYKILLRVLDHSKVKLTFNEHRLVMELLCSLTYMTNFSSNHHSLEKQKLEEERAALQEHLEMMVNKLMCNPDMKIKQLGIIGAVKIVSSLVSNVVLSSESLSNERISIDDIPNGLVKDAMQRMSFIIKSVGDNHHGFAMLCDEIALEFKLKENDCDINEVFLMWLSDIFFDQLKDLSVVPLEQTMPEIEGETLSHQLLVQTNDYSQPTLTINLGSLVLYQKTDKVVYLSSLFYVTRLMLMIRYQNLTELIVFAIMPITLTENFATSEDELNESDEALAMQKLDLYFHCANCLREIIGTFTHYNDDEPELKKCVVKRVKQLVQVEKHLNRLLKQVPSGYYPPAATFLDIDAKKKAFEVLRKEKRAAGNPPKKMRKKNNATAIDVTPEETTNKLRQFCREIDTNVIVLLMEEFKFESDVGDDEFGLEELQFLLDDVYHKIAFKCSARSAEQRGFYNPVAVISQLNQCVTPYIVAIFKGIRGELITMSQKASDDVSDAVFFTKDANMLKNCFCLILQMLEVILSCPKLKLEKNKELLTETLKAILPPEEELSNVDSQDQLSLLIFEHYTSLGKYVRNCESAVALLEFLLTVGKFSPTTQKESVRDLSEMFLKKVWKDSVGGDAKGAKFNINVEKILKIHVEFIDLQTIEKLIGLMKSDLAKISVKTLDHHSTFPSFNKDNSHVMLRAYMARSSRILESTDPKQLTEKFWLKFTKVYNDFKETTNVFSSLFEATKKGIMAQKAYIIFLSNFLVYIKVFNMSSKPVLESVLKYPERFTKLVKSTQDITRYAHGLSCDLKSHKNVAINTILPKLRHAQAKYNQVITAHLPGSGIPDEAILRGTLKNYDARGKAIESQNTVTTNSEDEDEDEQMDVSDDETLGNLDISHDDADQQGTFRSRSTIL